MNPIWRRLGPAHISLNVWPPLSTTPSPAECSNMRVEEDPHQGRHVVAARAMQPGATVITEEPYAASLDPEYRRSYCAQCLRQKPTVSCRQGKRCGLKVRFCSGRCEQRHWSNAHRWLCHLSAMENYAHMRDALLALQIYLRYASLPPLVSNLQQTPPDELAMYRERALFLVNAFFLDKRALDALITIQGQIRCNAFGNAIIIADDTHIEKKVIGVSLYHTASMFNHDCRPNAVALFDPARPALMRIRLTDPVKPGDAIHVSYGPLAAKNSRAERQKQLRRGYFFDCTCHACQSEGDLPHLYQCNQCGAAHSHRRCPQCRHALDLDLIRATEAKLKTEQNLGRRLKLQYKIYHPLAYPIGQTCDELAHHYAFEGDLRSAVKYCRQSLEIVKYHFGNCSLEAADEMFKLAGLLVDVAAQDTLSHINETIQLFQTLGLDTQNKTDYDQLITMQGQFFFN